MSYLFQTRFIRIVNTVVSLGLAQFSSLELEN